MNERLTALFHKLEVDGKVYYECRNILSEFTPGERFDSLVERQSSSKNDFYITTTSDELKKRGIIEKSIYIDNDGLEPINDEKLLKYLKKKFVTEEKDKVIREKEGGLPRELIDAYVTKIGDETRCQKKAIHEIISTIVYNRELNKSSLSPNTKVMHHDNIVLFGPIGNGTDMVLDAVEKNLQIPVIKLSLSGDTEMDVENLAQEIESSDREFKGNALVILECNYENNLDSIEEDFFRPLKEITYYNGTYTSPYLKAPIKFNELTYLMPFTVPEEMMDKEDVEEYFMTLTGMTKTIALPKLTMTQMRDVLYQGSYSTLKYCEETARKYGREFAVNKRAIATAIKFIGIVNGYMMMLDSAILESFKNQLEYNSGKITIDNEIIGYLAKIINIREASSKEPAIEPVEETETDDLIDPVEKTETDDLIDPVDQITNEILKTIKGQDKQVRRIVKTLLKNIQYANDDSITNPEKRKKNILIRGDSGTGKTEIIRRLAELINVPIFVADATQYTEEGYVGDSVNEMLLDLYHEAGDDIHKAERGILVIDEIDKKASSGIKNDVSRGAVLQSLLKIVEGTKKRIWHEKTLPNGMVTKEKIDFDTRRLSVICLGAFEELEKFREDRIKKGTKPKAPGFLSDEEQKVVEAEKKGINRDFINEDFSSFGMAIQFINRFENKVYLNKLTKENLIDIMKNSNLSALKLKQEDFLRDGIELEYTDDFYEKLGDLAISKKSGARSISEALEEVCDSTGVNDINTRLYSKIILNGDCITNSNAVIYIPRETAKQKVKS